MLCEVHEGRRLMGLQVNYDGFKLAISLERRGSAHSSVYVNLLVLLEEIFGAP